MPKSQYVCQQCSALHLRWVGRCESCNAWNSLVEEATSKYMPKGLGPAKGRKLDFAFLDRPQEKLSRCLSGITEFDRVIGGGLVSGSAILIGGDPGIGKSTMLLQITAALAHRKSCVYVSGEESITQIRMRAERIGLSSASVAVASATSVRDIISTLEGPNAPQVVIIDSIQTMFIDNLDSTPGTVAQVRGSAQELIRTTKRHGIVLLLVGHVTKEGAIAGPRVLEHMVDTVLYFEGDRGHQFRILRAVKNRFGATDEIGVFEMTERGLKEVSNPSALFLGNHNEEVSGTCVFAGMEGSRPMLVEIQSLIAPSVYGTPRRAVIGWDSGRLAMLLAVLDARFSVRLGNNDVYLNVAGGLRINEPAADLAVVSALLSSVSSRPIPYGTVIFGEVGLSGEVRAIGQIEARLKEATKLGFKNAIIPLHRERNIAPKGLDIQEITTLGELIALFGDLTADLCNTRTVKGAAYG